MNLVALLGPEQFNNKFGASFFRGPEGETCIVKRAGNSCVVADSVGGTANKPTSTTIEVPSEFFTDMGVFKTPPLGWRAAAQGRYLVHLSRNNTSYHRGTSPGNLRRVVSRLTEWFAQQQNMNLEYYTRDLVTAKLVMEPAYLGLAEGLALIAAGKIVAFPVNENLAVIPDTEEQFVLMFKDRAVGTVSNAGRITCEIPYVNKVLEAAA